MERDPNQIVILPSGHHFLWNEAELLNEDFYCKKCNRGHDGFIVTGFAHLGPLAETIFCVNCLSIVSKPKRLGRHLSSTHMPVTAHYTDGTSSEILSRYSEYGKSLKSVTHCENEMQQYAVIELKNGDTLEYQFGCPTCQHEREIRVIVRE